MHHTTLKIMIIGAHPDDPDVAAGGLAALYAERSHQVKMVSLTSGDAGHHQMGGAPLAWRRREEARAAGARLGCEYITLDTHDGHLLPTLEARQQVIGLIREFGPDVVITHRPYDYHPDHRYASRLVQDALFMVTVPNIVSSVPHLMRNPVALYLWDGFQRPYPFRPDIVVDIDGVAEQKLDALHCHTSQMYEWLPYGRGELDQVPDDPGSRRTWLAGVLEPRFRRAADLYRDRLVEVYGEERGTRVACAEAFEVCEYGAPLPPKELERLFPFIGKRGGAEGQGDP